MPELTLNADDLLALARSREAFLGGAIDAKRPTAWEQYGYPDDVTFDQLFRAYERGGPAHGAVHRILDKCWQRLPRIKPKGDKSPATEPGEWETAVGEMLGRINGWQKLRDLDRRNMVGRYAAIILRVADGQPLSAPLVAGRELVDIVPVYESQIKVTAWDSDTSSPNYGEPTMFQYRRRRPQALGDKQGQPDDWADVHPSRVVIMAEGSVGDFLEGVPLLKAGFNSLIDLEKIAGGSGESYLKNSARTIVIKFDQGATPAAIASEPGSTAPVDVKGAIEAKTKALNRNIDSSLVLQGGEASTLQTTVANPQPSFEVAANLFAASVRIPFTILFGQQTGRLASDEDAADFNARCLSRQVNEITPVLDRFVRRLQAANILPAQEFVIEWPPLDEPDAAAKVERFGKVTAGMKQAFDAGLPPLVEANELRAMIDLPPREESDDPGEGEPDADDLDEQDDEGQPRRSAPRLAA